MNSKRRRPSVATVIAVLALIVALGGTAIAAGLTHREKQQVKSIAKSQVNGKVKRLFARVAVDDERTVATIKGFEFQVSCSQGTADTILEVPAGVAVDGVSFRSSGGTDVVFGPGPDN